MRCRWLVAEPGLLSDRTGPVTGVAMDAAPLADRAPGGNPIHGLLAWEEAEILAVFEQWGDIDMWHRKLVHRGSYQHRVWVSPSTDRV